MKLKSNRLYWYSYMDEEIPELLFSISETLVLLLRASSRRTQKNKLKDISGWHLDCLEYFKEAITK